MIFIRRGFADQRNEKLLNNMFQHLLIGDGRVHTDLVVDFSIDNVLFQA